MQSTQWILKAQTAILALFLVILFIAGWCDAADPVNGPDTMSNPPALTPSIPLVPASSTTEITNTTTSTYIVKHESVQETRIYQIQNAKAQYIGSLVANLLTKTGRITADDRTNILIVFDLKDSLDKIEELIKKLDIPLETLIIPVKYGDATEILKMVSKTGVFRGSLNVDVKTNSIIVTDIPGNNAQVKTMVEQIDATLSNRPQIGLDCSLIKVTLDDKHGTGVDWTQCPFILKNETGSSLLLKNLDFQKLIDWLGKFGTAELLSRKRASVTPNEETRIKDGTRYQMVDRYYSNDSGGKAQYSYAVRGEDIGFIYRFMAKKGDVTAGKESVILSFSVDGVVPHGKATCAYSVTINNVQIENGTSLISEDIRRIQYVDDSTPPKAKFDNLNLILLVTPNSIESVKK